MASVSVSTALPHNFLSIKVKKQRYLGEQAIVIFLSDSTKKIRQKIQGM